MSDKLRDDRGKRQRTMVDVDGQLKLFMHLPEQVGGYVSLPDKEEVIRWLESSASAPAR